MNAIPSAGQARRYNFGASMSYNYIELLNESQERILALSKHLSFLLALLERYFQEKGAALA